MLGKTYHMGGTNFHMWHNSKLANLRHGISHLKFEFFDLNIIISYESTSRGPSVPSLGVENCNLHDNSIVPIYVQVSFIWVNLVTMQMGVFDS